MSDKVARVTLPREVAEAIEDLRNKGWRNTYLMRIPFTSSVSGTSSDIIRQYAVDNLETYMSALVNGYEIEKSPEDKVREYYEEMREVFKSTIDGSYDEEYLRGIMHGVVKTLNLLGIKVPGVNASAPGVNADA
jgi:hypothetical protein